MYAATNIASFFSVRPAFASDELNMQLLAHAAGKLLEGRDCGAASPVFDAADVGLPDAAAPGELLLREILLDARADQRPDDLHLRL